MFTRSALKKRIELLNEADSKALVDSVICTKTDEEIGRIVKSLKIKIMARNEFWNNLTEEE